MSTIKSVYLQHLNGTTPNATMDTNGNFTVGGTVSGASSNMFRNRIINGDMRIDQRNAGASVSFTSGGQYFVDRWCASGSASSKASMQQSSTAPTGFTNSLLVTSSTAWSITSSDYATLNQYIEGYNVADLGWGTANAKTITLSFWVRSSLTGTFGLAINNQINAANATRSIPYSYTINAANTWEYKTVTITGDTTGTWGTTNSGGISVIFSLAAGSNYLGTSGTWLGADARGVTGQTNLLATNGATWYITGVQLEVGTTATPFEVRSYGHELALCQRYYQRLPPTRPTSNLIISNGYTGSSTNAWLAIYHKVTMRSAPTITTSNWSGSSPSITSSGVDFTAFNFGNYNAYLNSDTDFQASAEL